MPLSRAAHANARTSARHVVAPLTLAAMVGACHPAVRTEAPVQHGFVTRTVVVDDTARAYQVFVPSDWSPDRKWPVILMLHGIGERGSDGVSQMQIGLAPVVRQEAATFPAVVVFPQTPAGASWNGVGTRIAMAALDATMRELHGDPDRVYLSGLSMGGYGTWELALRYPDRFAALVAVCPGVRHVPLDTILHVAAVDPDAPDAYEQIAHRLRGIPIWIFHGAADPVIPVSQSRDLAAALERAGARVRYTEYPGVGHGAWDRAYAEPELFPWLLAQHR